MLSLAILSSLFIVVLSAPSGPCPLPLCVECADGYENLQLKDEHGCEQCVCAAECTAGFDRVIVTEPNGVEGAYCKPNCDVVAKTCGFQMECVLQEVVCVKEPCFPTPVCVPNCSGGTVYNECGTPCPPKCDDLNPICVQVCTEQCQCPSNKPNWCESKGRCIKQKQCAGCRQ